MVSSSGRASRNWLSIRLRIAENKRKGSKRYVVYEYNMLCDFYLMFFFICFQKLERMHFCRPGAQENVPQCGCLHTHGNRLVLLPYLWRQFNVCRKWNRSLLRRKARCDLL